MKARSLRKILGLIFLSILLMSAVPLIGQKADVNAADTTLVKDLASVAFKSKVLFKIYGFYGPFSPEERAALVTTRLEELSSNTKVYPESLRAVPVNGEYNIQHGEFLIMTVGADDALKAEKPLAELTQEYLTNLKQEFIPILQTTTLRSKIINIAKITLTLIVVFVILGFLIKLINRLFKALIRRVSNFQNKNQAGLYVKGIRFLTREQIDTMIRFFLRLLKIAIILILFYIVLYLVLYTLPFTRSIAQKLQSYITVPLFAAGKAFINYIPNLFFIGVILFIAKYVLSLLRYIALEIEEGRIALGGFHPEWSKPTFQIVKFMIFFFVIVIIFPYLPGSNSPAFKGVSIFVGIIFSLGSSSAISNMIAGIILTYMRPYKIGDMIKVGDKFGHLFEFSLLVIRIRTLKNEEITIPNSLVLNGSITNYTKMNSPTDDLILHTTITIGYDVPWRQVHELLIKAAMQTEGIMKEREPFVLQKSLDDYYVAYELNAYTDAPEIMPRTYSVLHQNIQDCFREGNVEIMSPAYTAFRNGNQITIPKE
jgi:small-conductance mechanosensitive channel